VPCALRSFPLPDTPCLSPGMQLPPAAGTGRAAPGFILQAAVREPVHDSEGAMPGLRIEKIAPDRPPLALQARIEGTLILNVEISKSGDVLNSSLFSGPPMLAAAAARAIGAVTKGPRLARRGPT
jgi:outer membrane biosynthesis protein TonB